jgi:hypothetical protein
VRIATVTLAVVLSTTVAHAFLAPNCNDEQVSAVQIAQAIQDSPNANQALKTNSCNFGGAGMAESSGNTCASNGSNFGVLQLTSGNLPPGVTPDQYLNMPLQQQVDIWARQVGNSNTSGAYQTLQSSSSIGGTPVTAGMSAACFQFGPVICRNDVAFMQANNGACPAASSGGVLATSGARGSLNSGTANLDGNGQSICSWGGPIQNQINQAASACLNPTNPSSGGTSCPAGSSSPGNAISPNDAPLTLPDAVG